MQTPFKRVIAPLSLSVDFRDAYWSISRSASRWWLAGAVAADLAVQCLAGTPSLMTILSSLLTLVIFWTVPARLAGAVGGLYIGQAVISVAVVTAAAMTGSRLVTSVASFTWWAWCMFALVKLVMNYIRTPKVQMCG